MKRVVLCTLAVLLVTGLATARKSGKAAQASASSSAGTEEQIKKLEQDWANSVAKGDASAVEKYEASDILNTDPTGRVTDRAQDVQEVKSGDLKLQSLQLGDMQVHTYGNTAVVTGLGNLKGSFKGQDISGTYRFTDTWVNRNGTWQCVATESTKVMAMQQ
jgi:ketosteroid isomerase-like protein